MSRYVALIVLASGLTAVAADWPQWRGPNRDGKSAETGLLASWPQGGPRLAWKTQGLGEGYALPRRAGHKQQGQQRESDQSAGRQTAASRWEAGWELL